jgi:HEAT repeat protein
MSELNYDEIIEKIIANLDEKNEENNIEGFETIVSFGEKAVPKLMQVLGTEKWFVAKQLLAKIAEPAIFPLIEALRNPKLDAFAVHVLADIGKVAVIPLLNVLKDKNDDAREWVFLALGSIGDERAVTPLVNMLQDENENLQPLIIEALGKIGDKKAIEPIGAFLNSVKPENRLEAARALFKLGDKRGLVSLEDLV